MYAILEISTIILVNFSPYFYYFMFRAKMTAEGNKSQCRGLLQWNILARIPSLLVITTPTDHDDCAGTSADNHKMWFQNIFKTGTWRVDISQDLTQWPLGDLKEIIDQ